MKGQAALHPTPLTDRRTSASCGTAGWREESLVQGLRLKRASGWGPSAACPAVSELSGETAAHSTKARNRKDMLSLLFWLSPGDGSYAQPL